MRCTRVLLALAFVAGMATASSAAGQEHVPPLPNTKTLDVPDLFDCQRLGTCQDLPGLPGGGAGRDHPPLRPSISQPSSLQWSSLLDQDRQRIEAHAASLLEILRELAESPDEIEAYLATEEGTELLDRIESRTEALRVFLAASGLIQK